MSNTYHTVYLVSGWARYRPRNNYGGQEKLAREEYSCLVNVANEDMTEDEFEDIIERASYDYLRELHKGTHYESLCVTTIINLTEIKPKVN